MGRAKSHLFIHTFSPGLGAGDLTALGTDTFGAGGAGAVFSAFFEQPAAVKRPRIKKTNKNLKTDFLFSCILSTPHEKVLIKIYRKKTGIVALLKKATQ